MTEGFHHLFQLGADETPYRLLTSDYVSVENFAGKQVLKVDPKALSTLAHAALDDVSHLLRPGHLGQLRAILDDPEASSNDRFVALELLKNATIAAGRVLPMCQDTGTAITGAVRADYFVGWGATASDLAGRLRQPLQLWTLWPK